MSSSKKMTLDARERGWYHLLFRPRQHGRSGLFQGRRARRSFCPLPSDTNVGPSESGRRTRFSTTSLELSQYMFVLFLGQCAEYHILRSHVIFGRELSGFHHTDTTFERSNSYSDKPISLSTSTLHMSNSFLIHIPTKNKQTPVQRAY